MKITSIVKSLSGLTGRTGLVLQKHSPEILLVMGIGGVVASTVLACRSTLKVESVLDHHNEKMEQVNGAWKKIQDGEIVTDDYTEKDHQRDLTVIYAQTAVDFVKLYGPAVTLGVASIACLISSHGIMTKRNVALVAAYKAVEEAFTAYRKRVVEEHGEEADYMYRHNLRKEETIEAAYTDDDGVKHKAEKKTQMVSKGPNDYSMYAKIFDESCSQWTKDPEYNFMFLRQQQNYFNDLLQVRGHVFLNEVYDALGFERTSAGSQVGWVVGKGRNGDQFIDFGLFDQDKPRARAFVNGQERSVILDFNVDGTIWNLI